MAPHLNQNIRGYEVGEIKAKGAVTVDLHCPNVPMQEFIDVQYMDSRTMSRRPGMHLKYLPVRYNEVTGHLHTGGYYLFDTFDDAKEYGRWTTEDFEVGDTKVKFFEHPMFLGSQRWIWNVVGAHTWAPLIEHAVSNMQIWSYSSKAPDVEGVLQDTYATLKSVAEDQGAVSFWLLHNPETKMVGIQTAFRKVIEGDGEGALQQSLQDVSNKEPLERLLPASLSLKILFSRISLLLTLWLPKSRTVGGTELCIPLHPTFPAITHDFI